MAKILKKMGIYTVSTLGALGIVVQNFMAVSSLVKDVMSASFAASKAGLGLSYGIAATLGGMCSGLVNLFINVDLLKSFYKRLTKKKRPELKGWEKFRYWAGSSVFVITGILFGLTAIAFGPVGVLAAIGIASGIFVAVIMMIQELETWLESFDDKKNKEPKTIKELFFEWKASLTKGKVLGVVIAIGNVVALSLLFTVGLASFLMSAGVAALPALIVGAVVAFTGGAFTEFYFYNRFLSEFCHSISDKWQKIKNSKYYGLGIAAASLNAIVGGVLSYVGIMMLPAILIAAGVAVPPLGVLMAVAIVASIFAAAASFVLGVDFWQRTQQKPKDNDIKEMEKPLLDTKSILSELEVHSKEARIPDKTPYVLSGDKLSEKPKNDSYIDQSTLTLFAKPLNMPRNTDYIPAQSLPQFNGATLK